jgi:photosystem II stability/assembly factor-like uncharacterized protein
MKTLRKIALYLLMAGSGPAQISVSADSGWFWQNPLPTGNSLLAVTMLDVNTVVAVGDLGTILRTTDGGATWTQQASGTTAYLSGAYFTDANTGTVVGCKDYDLDGNCTANTILRTTDGGATWKQQSSGTTAALRGVFFTDANTGTAVGDAGIILRTTDGGATWKQQSGFEFGGTPLSDFPLIAGGTTTYLRGVFFTDANTGTAVGYNGTILRTTTGGEPVASQTTPGTKRRF